MLLVGGSAAPYAHGVAIYLLRLAALRKSPALLARLRLARLWALGGSRGRLILERALTQPQLRRVLLRADWSPPHPQICARRNGRLSVVAACLDLPDLHPTPSDIQSCGHSEAGHTAITPFMPHKNHGILEHAAMMSAACSFSLSSGNKK